MRPTGPAEDGAMPPFVQQQHRSFSGELDLGQPPQQRTPRRSADPRTRPAVTGPAAMSGVGALLRGFSGSLAAGAVVLALGLIGFQIWASGRGLVGPGLPDVISQSLAAVLAVGLQRSADRDPGGRGAAASVGAIAVVLGSVWFWWWL